MRMRHANAGDHGFTLIELVTAVAVVGILTAIAIPSYFSYVRKANRTDAKDTMMQYAQALQRCYSQYFTYTPTPACSTTAGTTTTRYYSITVATPSATTYSITAVPAVSPQTSDRQCMKFVLNSTGQQLAYDSSNTDNTLTCWGSQ